MGDLRNKRRKEADRIAQAAILARIHPPLPPAEPPGCRCGRVAHWAEHQGLLDPVLFFCPACAPDDLLGLPAMCNLYSMTKPVKAIRDLFGPLHDMTNDMAPLPAIFPNRMAPVVRKVGSESELLMMRWGFPPPTVPGRKPRNPYLTNIRNTDSRYWQTYLKKPEHRCLVPVTSFAEPDNNQGPKSIWTWFARSESRPLFFFAGIWRAWEGDRGTKAFPNIGKHLVFSFLTTDASHDVSPVHSDATPVCLFDEAARETWMTAPWELARELQRSPAPGSLRVVAAGPKQDG